MSTYKLMESALRLLGIDDDEVIEYILTSKFGDGTDMFTQDNIIFFYNFCGFVKHYSIEQCIQYINYLSDLESWTDELMNTNPERTLDDLHDYYSKIQRDKMLPSIKGIFKCRHCGSDNVMQSEKISRADEAAIVARKCATCGYRT